MEGKLRSLQEEFHSYRKEAEIRIKTLADTAKAKGKAKKRLKAAVSEVEATSEAAIQAAQRTIGELEDRVKQVEAELLAFREHNLRLQARESSLSADLKKAQRETSRLLSDLETERELRQSVEQSALSQLAVIQTRLEEATFKADTEASATSRSLTLQSRLRMLEEIQSLLHTCRSTLTS